MVVITLTDGAVKVRVEAVCCIAARVRRKPSLLLAATGLHVTKLGAPDIESLCTRLGEMHGMRACKMQVYVRTANMLCAIGNSRRNLTAGSCSKRLTAPCSAKFELPRRVCTFATLLQSRAHYTFHCSAPLALCVSAAPALTPFAALPTLLPAISHYQSFRVLLITWPLAF